MGANATENDLTLRLAQPSDAEPACALVRRSLNCFLKSCEIKFSIYDVVPFCTILLNIWYAIIG